MRNDIDLRSLPCAFCGVDIDDLPDNQFGYGMDIYRPVSLVQPDEPEVFSIYLCPDCFDKKMKALGIKSFKGRDCR